MNIKEIPDYEIEGLIKTLREMGIRGLMEWSDVLVLNHIQERNYVPSDRNSLIKVLKENTNMEYSEIMNLLQRYEKWKEVLPSYSLGLNQKLDSVNKRFNSVVPFRWIGRGQTKKLIGFVEEGNSINVYDGIGKHLMLCCTIDRNKWTMKWNDYVKLTTPQQKYIVDETKNLKETYWL